MLQHHFHDREEMASELNLKSTEMDEMHPSDLAARIFKYCAVNRISLDSVIMQMAKKKEMTPQEEKLYNDLKKLAKRANQRLVRLERLTGEKGTFASKQLYDYLDSSELQALSKTGRIRVSKNFSFTQLKAIIKATNQFLESPTSTQSRSKKENKRIFRKSRKTYII